MRSHQRLVMDIIVWILLKFIIYQLSITIFNDRERLLYIILYRLFYGDDNIIFLLFFLNRLECKYGDYFSRSRN